MRYVLRKDAIGALPEIEISANEYSDFQRARGILSNAMAIEEKYEVVLSNYLDFEREIFNGAVSEMVRSNFAYTGAFERRLALNIRLINLLTSVRLYVDQLGLNVRACVPDNPGVAEQVKGLFSREYDRSKDYRFMEALRNHVQHRGLPVHLVKVGGQWISTDDDGSIEFSLDLFSDRSFLHNDPNFKKSVLNELDEHIDLKAAARSYIESIGTAHDAIRGLVTESVTWARELVENAHQRYASVYTGSLVGLSACKWEGARQVSSVPLLLEWDNVRLELQNRNATPANLRKCYVTGRLKRLAD